MINTCGGGESTFSDINTINCNGVSSCLFNSFINIKTLNCNADWSCNDIIVSNVSNIICNGYNACNTITSHTQSSNNIIDRILCNNDFNCRNINLLNISNLNYIECTGYDSCMNINLTQIDTMICNGSKHDVSRSTCSFINVTKLINNFECEESVRCNNIILNGYNGSTIRLNSKWKNSVICNCNIPISLSGSENRISL